MQPPSKSYPGFRLSAYRNGQWAKKIQGKIGYFGPWADPDAATSLARFFGISLNYACNPSCPV